MNQSEGASEFKKGLQALRGGYLNSALGHMQKAVENDKNDPIYLSFYGLALARTCTDWAMAEAYCLAAVQMKPADVQLYLNLAEVYHRGARMQDALSALYNGLQFTKWDPLLVRAVEGFGIRRPPVLPFLDRKNFLNRHLGKLRHRLSGRSKVSALEGLRSTPS